MLSNAQIPLNYALKEKLSINNMKKMFYIISNLTELLSSFILFYYTKRILNSTSKTYSHNFLFLHW